MHQTPRLAESREPWARISATLRAPVDGASLAVFRIVFGAIMALELMRHFWLNRIELFYIAPKLLFPYWGFDWLPRLSGGANFVAFGVLIALALAIACGAFYRLAAPLFCLGYSYFFLLDQTHYQNHLYLFCLLAALLSCTSAHHVWSVDAWRKRLPPSVPAWHVAIVAFQIGVVYFFGGVNKLSHEWLSATPMDLQLDELRDLAWAPGFVHDPKVAHFFAWSGLIVDLSAVPLLLLHRTRLLMLAVLCGFHLFNSVLFSIGVFPWFMLVGTTIFLPPSWPRRLLRSATPPLVEPTSVSRRGPGHYLAVAAACCYVVLQLLLPLRHHLYPGTWLWSRDGEYFSWTMKLNVRAASIKLLIREPDGKENEVPLYAFLSAKQRDRLAYTPEMVLRVNHFVVKALEPMRRARWVSRVSINGRPDQDYLIEDARSLDQYSVSLRPSRYLQAFKGGDPPTPEALAQARKNRHANN